MFRRFRQRRALRAMEKKKKLQQQSKGSDESTSRLTTTIFRSIDSTTTFQNIPSVRTVGSSFSGSGDHEVDGVKRTVPPATPTSDTSSATTSPNDDTTSISCTSFAKGVLLVGGVDLNKDEQAIKEPLLVDTTRPQVLQRMAALSGPHTCEIVPKTHYHNHKRSSSCTNSTAKFFLRNVLDEIHSEIFVSEQMKEELFAAQIQLAFFKESYDEVENVLHQKDAVIQRQHLELLLGRKVMTYTKNELSSTKTAFQESVLTLVDMKMTLLSLHDQLNQQQLELLTLKENPMATIQ